MPISSASMYWRPIPCRIARASAAASAGRSGARLTPRISLASRSRGQRPGGPQPALGQPVGDRRRGDHAAHRPPRRSVLSPPIRSTGDCAGADAAQQLDEHRVDAPRVAAGVEVQRLVLERDADEAGRHRLAGRRVADLGRDGRSRSALATPGAAASSASTLAAAAIASRGVRHRSDPMRPSLRRTAGIVAHVRRARAALTRAAHVPRGVTRWQ